MARPDHRRGHWGHRLDPGPAATAVLADLVETTVDLYGLYGAELARHLGITCPSLLTPDVGHAITIAVRKDDTLHPRDSLHGHDSTVPPGLGSGPSWSP